ncbi:hypothetical protein TNCT_385551 [Trichonephila clavata]|uniref:Uncharacterized protein n=1 Tax=Trichonephila clavata TaxID=2740835 RepID=A0A8X6M558_TRICU|nr:hypothetical protein TNCT_385551 [Trichonephila clavata]
MSNISRSNNRGSFFELYNPFHTVCERHRSPLYNKGREKLMAGDGCLGGRVPFLPLKCCAPVDELAQLRFTNCTFTPRVQKNSLVGGVAVVHSCGSGYCFDVPQRELVHRLVY